MSNAADVLADWQRKEQEFLERVGNGSLRPGVATPEQAAGKSGLEFLGGLLRGDLPFALIAETLDFFLVEVEKGRAVFQGRPSKRLYNPLGTVHGGWYATLLDSAVGCAVHTCMPAGRSYTTLELKVNMVRPLTDKVPLVRAEGNVVHLGGQIATAEGTLFGPDGKLYGHASTTCLIFDLPPAAERGGKSEAAVDAQLRLTDVRVAGTQQLAWISLRVQRLAPPCTSSRMSKNPMDPHMPPPDAALHGLIRHLPFPLVLFGTGSDMGFANDRFAEVFLAGQLDGPELQRLTRQPGSRWQTVELRRRDGATQRARAQAIGVPYGVLVVIDDAPGQLSVEEHERLQQRIAELESLSATDRLTGSGLLPAVSTGGQRCKSGPIGRSLHYHPSDDDHRSGRASA